MLIVVVLKLLFFVFMVTHIQSTVLYLAFFVKKTTFLKEKSNTISSCPF